MIHKQLVMGMISTTLLLAACEPVDEALETDEMETKSNEAVVTDDSEPEEEVMDEAYSDEEVSSDESTDIVAEEDAGYEVLEKTEDIEETESEMVDEDADLVFDIDALELPNPEDLPLDTVYIEVNENIPLFTNEDLEVSEPFQSYETEDDLGRVGVADALLDVELMPAEERGSIGHIDPTGWNQGNYEIVSGNWLYNRSHLIGHQMTGYDGRDNLMTGTRQFNVEGMLPFENFVASVVEYSEMQVRYRVTPLFEEENLLSHGILMEGFSVDDNGETLTFNVFVPNQQDGIELDYETGDHQLVE
ncbi:DNA/RNA non-specific endonuclease [Alkalibacterium sp. f15]|uniref:DNA/RNA non-specific endonuclease n=1 Tax=Alkalibacterium sp. f15 TaxID=3414029 RepID=UPI003BF8689B